MFLLAFFGSLHFTFLLPPVGDLLPVLDVLILVQGRSALFIDELVVRDQPLLSMRLELDHLLEGNDIVLAAAVEPQLVEHLTIDSVTVGKLVTVKL